MFRPSFLIDLWRTLTFAQSWRLMLRWPSALVKLRRLVALEALAMKVHRFVAIQRVHYSVTP